MHHLLSLATGIAGLFAAFCSVAAAQAPAPATPLRIGGDKGWEAFSYSEKGGKVCYLVGRPAKSEPASFKRGRIDALVTHRPQEKALNVVNFNVGYALKEGSNVELDIDGQKFSLFTQKDAAWASDADTDKAVTEALAKGKRAMLKGSSVKGAATTDTYALEGFKETLAAIDKACGVKR